MHQSAYGKIIIFCLDFKSYLKLTVILSCAGRPLTHLIIMIIKMCLCFISSQLARPKHRRHTLVFSRHACILQEEGHLTLQIRVGDMRRSHLIDTRVHGVLVKRYVVDEKYVYPLYQYQVSEEFFCNKNDYVHQLSQHKNRYFICMKLVRQRSLWIPGEEVSFTKQYVHQLSGYPVRSCPLQKVSMSVSSLDTR